MLDLAILGLLFEQEMHGYEIRRRLRDELGLFANISFGSLYPALSRLERSGAVTVTESGGSATTSIPATGSLSGERAGLRARRSGASLGTKRSRKVYRITDAGPGRCSSSCSRARSRRAPTTPAASVCVWPSPAIWPPRPGWPCWSAAEPS